MRKDFVYLASSSPRRRALLAQIGVPFEVVPAEIDESHADGELPAGYVRRLAEQKAEAVWQGLEAARAQPVLAADTAVVVDGRLFGKPVDTRAAIEMLTALSGRCHSVLTAVSVRFGAHVETRLVDTEVRFRTTTARERRAYCKTGEPLDKAGAYGIQGLGAVFVEHISGSYSAVMGLPLLETALLLAGFGVPRWLTRGQSAA